MKAVCHYNEGAYTSPVRNRLKKGYLKPFTLIVDNLPTIEQLTANLTLFMSGNSPKISLVVGSSVVHPLDQFNRKKGIRLAESRLGEELFEITAVYMTKEYTSVTMTHLGSGKDLALRYVKSGRPEILPYYNTSELAYALSGTNS